MLTEKQRLAALHLACGLSCKETAALVGCTPNTLSVWRQNPRFRAEIAKEQYALLAETRAQLLNASGVAIQALKDIAQSGEDETARVNAAKTLLNNVRLTPNGNDCGVEMSLGLEPEADPLLLDLADLLAQHSEGWCPEDAFLDFLSEEKILDDPEGVEALLSDEIFRHQLMAQFRATMREQPLRLLDGGAHDRD